MRTLLARSRSESVVLEPANNDAPEILRLFGSSAAIGSGRIQNSRLKFSDCFLSNETELKKRAESVTEVKFENTIDRRTAVANPRQIERVIRGAEFALEIIYDLDELDEVDDDFRTLREGLTLIELDYLGGHGTRGSGRIEFESLSVKCVYGTVENSLTEECNAILGGK
jgi:CRISPR-associated protein Csm3